MIELALGLLVTFVGAAVQASVGFGFAVVSIPVLALVDTRMVPVPQLLVSFPLAWLMVKRERAHLDLKGMGWILAGRVIGAAAAVPLLVSLSGRSLELSIGIIVLLLTLASNSDVVLPMRPAGKITAGSVAGATGLLASMGGPPLALLYRNEPAAKLRSSLAAVFLFGLTVSLLVRIGAGEIVRTDVWIALAILPALVLGYLAGARLAPHLDRRGIRTYVLAGSAAASVALIVKALV